MEEKKNLLTYAGLKKLEEELHDLKVVKRKEVAEKIDQVSGRGCTFLKAEGSFARDKKDVVLCACNNKQMYIIRTAIKEVDPNAFIIIMESNEVLGEGFKAH